MGWIFLAAFAELLNAIVAILDKYIVTDKNALPRPFVYAFYSCLLTGFWVIVFAFGFIPGFAALGVPSLAHVSFPDITVVSMSFLAAYAFFMALVSMYEALKKYDASDVMPAIGAISAISAFAMSFAFLGAVLPPNFIWGMALLSLGTFLLSRVRFNGSVILSIIHSGLFFGIHYVTMKGLFMQTNFDNGFFWSRIAFFVFALLLLMVPMYYEKIHAQTKATSKRTGALVLIAKMLAGVAALLLLKATDLGDVSVVQSLDGLKFVFIILIGLLIGKHLPHTAGENEFDFKTVIRKSLYIAVIFIGFMILFI
jgi:drug/metabolite transporter (DMT)-like permease